MDKNASVERRFSLNMTNPVAESTCLNLNGSGHMSKATKFRWGGSPISQKNRSNSSVCLNNTTASNKSRSASSPHRARMNLNKIDPRIYADVQSKGLASRIVQYHENGTRLNRSMSASNLYNKPGQFPVVHLQKTELPYRATQQNVSMTRIAPPEKSVFRGNTLSSLLRSNSVISLQKSDEEISRENRPILHPPAAEGELAPTRSVLDVLKEISRKRINSDDSDSVHDATKKYCNRDCNDAPAYETNGPNANARDMNAPMHPILYPTQCFKRQRESGTHQQPLEYAYSNNVSAASAEAGKSTQTQNSPEQIAKKRLCSYNNDITSSLSSSLIHANKRKFYEQQRTAVQRSPPSLIDDFEAQRSKRQQSDLRFQQLTKSLNCTTPITPIPDTPLHKNIDDLQIIPSNGDNTSGLIQRTVSEPPYTNVKNINKVNTAEKNQKPRLTLFNRNYDETTDVGGENRDIDELESDANNECADIQFVKPKKSSSVLNKKNPLMERTQKSKLALMFSGLRGELYQEDDDEVDKARTAPIIAQTPITSNGTIAIQSNFKVTMPSVNITNTTATTTKAISAVIQNDDSKSATSSNTKNSSPKPSPPLIPTTMETPTTTSGTSTNITTTSTAIGGFKFTPPIATVTPNSTNSIVNSSSVAAAVTTTAPTKTSSPLVGIKLTPQVPTQSALVSAATSVPSFTFGAPAANTVANTISTGLGAVPQLLGFASNKTNNKAETTTAVTATPSATTISNSTLLAKSQASRIVGGFKFGTTNTTITSNATISANPILSFGSLTTTAPTTATVSTLSTAPTFNFGTSISTSNTVSTNAQPSINFAATTTTAPTFNFSATTNANNASTTASAAILNNTTQSNNVPTNTQFGPPNASNVFGVPSNVFATPAATKPFAFGTSTSASIAPATTSSATPTNTFSFGGANSAPQKPSVTTTTFAFGASKPTDATASTTSTPFAFGATAQPTMASTMTTTSAPVSAFNFGGGQVAAANVKTTTATNINASNSNLFAFGSSVTPTTVTPASTNTPKVFSNNTASIDTNQSMSTTKPSTIPFGSAAAAVGTNQQLSTSFGPTNTNSTPFAFGGTNPNKPITTTTAGGFNFGGTAGAPTATNSAPTNLFGATVNNPTPSPASNIAPTTNIVKPSFSFGSNIATTNTDTSKSIFGGATTNNTNNSNNAFASLAATNDNQHNKTFSFGQNAESAPTNNVNIFSATAPTKPATGGFSFNANTLNKPTAVAAPNAGSFAFGSSNNMNNSANEPFSFGGNNASASSKTFNFGSSSTAPSATNSGSIFGGGAAMTNGAESTQSAATPFTLSTGMTTAATAAAPPTNLFAPQPNMSSGPSVRPIRRATRRLQKT